MGLFDFDFIDDAKEAIGNAIDGASDRVGDGLRAIGLDDAASAVEILGEKAADALGAMPDEKELDETRDPKELVRGEPDAIRDRAGQLDGFSSNFTSAGDGLRGISVGDWSGEGADGYQRASESQFPKWYVAASASSEAASALRGWAEDVDFAQRKAAEAVRIWEEGKRKQQEWRDEAQRKITAYNDAVDDYNNDRRSVPPAKPDIGTDPWPEYKANAERTLKAGRDHRNSAAPGVQAALQGAADKAPPMPSTGAQLAMTAGDTASGATTAYTHFQAGVAGAVTETVKTIRMVNPTDAYNVADPRSYARNVATLGAGLVKQVANPDEAVRNFIGEGWSTDPAYAAGGFTANIMMSVLPGPKGGGMVAAAARSVRGATPEAGVAASAARSATHMSPDSARGAASSGVDRAPSGTDAMPASYRPGASPSVGGDSPPTPATHQASTTAPSQVPPSQASPPTPGPDSTPPSGPPGGGPPDRGSTALPDSGPAPDSGGGGQPGSTPQSNGAGSPSGAAAPSDAGPTPSDAGADAGAGARGDTGAPRADTSSTPQPAADHTGSPAGASQESPSAGRDDAGMDRPPGDHSGQVGQSAGASADTGGTTTDAPTAGRDGQPSAATGSDAADPRPTPGHTDGGTPAGTHSPAGETTAGRSAIDGTPDGPRHDSDAPPTSPAAASAPLHGVTHDALDGSSKPVGDVAQRFDDAPRFGTAADNTPFASPKPDVPQGLRDDWAPGKGDALSPVSPAAPLQHAPSATHGSPEATPPGKHTASPTSAPTPSRSDGPPATARADPSIPDRPAARADAPGIGRDGDRPGAGTARAAHDSPQPATRHVPDRDAVASSHQRPAAPASHADSPGVAAHLTDTRGVGGDRPTGSGPAAPDTPRTHPGSPPDHAGRPGGRDIDDDTGRPHDPGNAREINDGAAEQAEKASGNEEPGQSTQRGDPVNIATGEYFLPITDLELPGVLPLRLTHRHRSRYRWGKWFGPTSASTWDGRAIVTDDAVTIVTADGSLLKFPHPQPDSPSRTENDSDWRLAVTAAGGFRMWHIRTRVAYFYTPLPQLEGADVAAGSIALSAITDRHRNRILFGYDANGWPTTVEHSAGYRVAVECDGARILGYRVIAGIDGQPADHRVCTFHYHRGHLAATTNAGGATTLFEYDDAGRMTSWTDSLGMQYWNRYDDLGRVTRQSGVDGIWAGSFSYRTRPDGSGSITTYTDSDGATTVFGIDTDDRIRREFDPMGREVATDYNSHRQPIEVSLGDGIRTRYRYTADGDVERIIDPDGAVTQITYSGPGLPRTITAPGNVRTTIEHDADGNVTSVADNAGAATTYHYDASGALVTVSDPDGVTVRYRNNAAGLPVEVIDARGGTTRVDYDFRGLPAAVIDPGGGRTEFSYDADGNRTGAVAADGAAQRWEYDGEGNCTRFVNPEGAVTRWEYGYYDLPVARIDADGTRTDFTYNAARRLVAVTNAAGLVWRYSHNADGTLAEETDFSGATTSYGYDEVGRLRSVTNAAGQTITYDYDPSGRVIGERGTSPDGDGETVEYAYDPAGRLHKVRGPFGEYDSVFDAVGRPVSVTSGGGTVATQWTAAGRLGRVTTPTGVSSRYSYDVRGLVESVRSAGRDCGFDLDAAGLERRRRFSGVAVDSVWDPLGRLTGRSIVAAPADPAALSLGPAVVDAAERVVDGAAYRYRADGALVSSVQDGRPVEYEVDVLGRIAGRTSPGGRESFTFDAAGNMSTTVRDVGVPGTAGGPTGSGRWRYEGTLLVDDGRCSYRYDGAGRVVEMRRRRLSRKPEVWRYAWDAWDRLREVRTPDGAVFEYLYDHAGRRVQKTNTATGEVTRFHWCGERLVEQVGPVGADEPGMVPDVVSWAYAPGSLAPIAQSHTVAGVTGAPAPDPDTVSGIDVGLNLGEPATQPSSEPTWSQDEIDREFFAIVTDQIDAPTALLDADSGEIVGRAIRTVWGATAWDGRSTPWGYPGQYLDDETGLYYNRHRYYHPDTGRYLSPDPLGLAPATNPYAYPGNPTVVCDPLGLMPEYPQEHPLWDRVHEIVQPPPSSAVPERFNLSMLDGSMIHVPHTATKHIYQETDHMHPEIRRVAEQVRLEDLVAVLDTIDRRTGIDRFVNNWELKYSEPRAAGEFTALTHARWNPKRSEK